MSDTATMIGRSIRLTRRNVDTLLMAIVLPVLLMLLFVYVFGGAIDTGTEYVNYVVPGIILLCAGYGAASTAMAVAGRHDQRHDRPAALAADPQLAPCSPGTSSPASRATRCRPPSSSAPRSRWGSGPTRRSPTGWLAAGLLAAVRARAVLAGGRARR